MAILKRCGIAGLFFLTAILFMAGAPARAQEESQATKLQQHEVEAGLLYNFLKYTSWPGKGPLNICLFGGDPFEGSLSPLEGRTAQQRIINITALGNPDENRNCNVVFVNRSREDDLPALIKHFQSTAVLTVSDIDGFAHDGGMIEFAMGADRHIHLYINQRAVSASGLVIQDRLLRLAGREDGE
jgi:hypothetical protein